MENLSNFSATPKLGFGEAVKKVLSNVINFKGRARRSEFWWAALAFTIFNVVVSAFLSAFPGVSTIVSFLLSLLMLAVTVRRLQDSGHSAWWEYINFIASLVMGLYVQFGGYMDAVQAVNPNPADMMNCIASPLFWIPAAVDTVTGIAVFIFCLFDSQVGPNKYGDSPKYVLAE